MGHNCVSTESHWLFLHRLALLALPCRCCEQGICEPAQSASDQLNRSFLKALHDMRLVAQASAPPLLSHVDPHLLSSVGGLASPESEIDQT